MSVADHGRVRPPSHRRPTYGKVLETYLKKLSLSSNQLHSIVEDFEEEMQRGLNDEKSDLFMIPTMVDVIPKGTETGAFIGVEVGSAKLRMVYARLSEECHEVDMVQVQEMFMPDEKRHCTTEELFIYVAQQAMDFAHSIGRDLKTETQSVLVGFCFDFPCEHETINSGRLLTWTKGFENAGGVGYDPAKALSHAFAHLGVSVKVEALANGTVGVLASTRYMHGPNADVAGIMDTGTNACYVEHVANINNEFRLKNVTRGPDMVVNIELPGFRAQGIERLEEDNALNAESHHPGEQTFEKLTSGLYMGEIARRIILSVAEGENWPCGDGWVRMREPSNFTTTELAIVAQDGSENLRRVANVLSVCTNEAEASFPAEMLDEVKQICLLVTKRSAQLMAAAILGVLKHMDAENAKEFTESHKLQNIVAVDGGVFNTYRLYRDLFCEAVQKIAGDDFAGRFKLERTENAGVFGAVTIAAAAVAAAAETSDVFSVESIKESHAE